LVVFGGMERQRPGGEMTYVDGAPTPKKCQALIPGPSPRCVEGEGS